MEGLISRLIAKQFPETLAEGGAVDVPFGWVHIAKRAVVALRDLNPGLRVAAVGRKDGMMQIAIDYEPTDVIDELESVVVNGTLDKAERIVADAKTLSAWTCVHDGQPGWLVFGRTGPVVLCPDCQRQKGITVRRHEA